MVILDQFPIWAVYVGTVAVVIVVAEIGFLHRHMATEPGS
jgi:hypothetical protein